MKYRCKKEFLLDCIDNDGSMIANKYKKVRLGEIFEKSDEPYRICGKRESIRLENLDGWVEVSPKTLEKFFNVMEG